MATLLDRINGPADLKPLGAGDLTALSEDVRKLIIDTVSKTGGHLAANLGVVELTVALLKTFAPPDDKIIWDVSHQAYTYKILTGRRDRFPTLRQHGGISGFLSRAESEYDCFGAGHSGTALSAALGIAAARDRTGGSEHVVAVVGDATLGCGISFEALNNVASTTKRLIVILNDNEMSISANVGSLSRYLGGLLANPRYNRWKSSVEGMVRRHVKTDFVRRVYYRIEEAVKSLFLHSVFFEEMGLRYIGPIDGHNIPVLLDALQIARNSPQPILLHVSTQKGRGYDFAEERPDVWHGVSGFEVCSGKLAPSSGGLTYSEAFGRTLERLAEQDERIVAITAAMRSGTGMASFSRRFPGRFFDVGISEEHAVIFAAGLASRGLRPILPLYSTFSQRSVDCVIHDVCLQRLPVVICLDRAGIVGDDGPTHHGVFDIPLFRSVPNLVMMQPRDQGELFSMMHAAVAWGRPVIIRYPRGCGPAEALPSSPGAIEVGRAEVLREGTDVQIWALGDMLTMAQDAANRLAAAGVTAGIVNPRFIRPVDDALLHAQAARARVFATIENGLLAGGFGSGVAEVLGAGGYSGRILRFGWPDRFIPHGAAPVLMSECGLTGAHIADGILSALGRVGGPPDALPPR